MDDSKQKVFDDISRCASALSDCLYVEETECGEYPRWHADVNGHGDFVELATVPGESAHDLICCVDHADVATLRRVSSAIGKFAALLAKWEMERAA